MKKNVKMPIIVPFGGCGVGSPWGGGHYMCGCDRCNPQ